MEFSEHVYILQLGKFKEADLWVRFLSPTRGILSGFAFGGSRSRRRFIGCLDVFNQVLLRVEQNRRNGYLILQEGILLQGQRRLRQDWLRYGIAMNCAKFLQAVQVESENAKLAYMLFEETLRIIEEADNLPKILPFFFRARLASEQGYAVNTSTCAACGVSLNGEEGYLHVRKGLVVCTACSRKVHSHLLYLRPDALTALQSALHEMPLAWLKLDTSSSGSNECARAIDSLLQYHVGVVWENGFFSRS